MTNSEFNKLCVKLRTTYTNDPAVQKLIQHARVSRQCIIGLIDELDAWDEDHEIIGWVDDGEEIAPGDPDDPHEFKV